MNLSLSKKRYRTKFIQKDENGNVYCYHCKQYKNTVEFNNSPQESDIFYRCGKDKRCKSCKKAQNEKRRINNRGNGTIDRILLERWHGAKSRAKANGLFLDFDVNYLKELWEKQNGKCALSGIDMTYKIFQGRINTNVSIDRIDSTKGYIKNNIQLVCMVINQMKNDLSVSELIHFCKNIIKTYEG